MRNILTGAAAAALMLTATSASALTYTWSFVANAGTSFGLVTGTISGLQIGGNVGTGLSVEVLTSPSGNVLGAGWSFFDTQNGGTAFLVDAAKNVTFADAQFRRSGLDEQLLFGGFGGYVPSLYSGIESDGGNLYSSHFTFDSPTSFSLVAPDVPLPAALPLLLAGLGGLGLMARRKRAA